MVYTKVSTYFNVENKLSYEYYYATFATIVVFLHFTLGRCIPRHTIYQPSTYLKFSTCLGIDGNIFSDFALVCASVRRSRRTDNIFCGNQL